MEPLLLAVTMMPGMRRADGSVTLKQVSMEELSTAQFSHIDEYRGVNGWLQFAPNPQQLGSVPEEAAEGRYSPSQLLRLELLRLHLARDGNKENFQPFYEAEIAKITAKVAEARRA